MVYHILTSMERKFVLLALILLASVCVRSQSEIIIGDYKIKGIVKTKNAEVISGLTLFVAKGEQVRTFTSDINGEFELRLQPGEYVVTVNKVNSTDFKAFLKIIDKGLNPDNIEFVFDPESICCRTVAGISFPKATSLPRPAYPPAARAVRASGEAVVDLIIGQDGKVISAKAVSGHPLIRAAAEAAARGSRFAIAESGEDREAILTYVFLLDGTVKPTLTTYKNQYRIEVVSIFEVVNTVDR